MTKKKNKNIGAKILVWVMLIAMIGSLIAGVLVYLIN